MESLLLLVLSFEFPKPEMNGVEVEIVRKNVISLSDLSGYINDTGSYELIFSINDGNETYYPYRPNYGILREMWVTYPGDEIKYGWIS